MKGRIAAPVPLLYDSLMTASSDEAAAEYGLLAEAVSFPADVSSATYRLRAQAKWHDGKPVTPEDVVFSFDAFKRSSPRYSAYYRQVVKAAKTGEREVTFTFEPLAIPFCCARASGISTKKPGCSSFKTPLCWCCVQ